MICLVFAQSRLYVATIIFYTCVLIPFLHIKQALLSIIGMVSGTCQQPMERFNMACLEGTCCEQFDDDLPVARFGELGCINDLCSVCLSEFEREEEVSQLSGCGHVFHLRCIKSWLSRNRFTCPLCRSVFINAVDVCHGKCGILNMF